MQLEQEHLKTLFKTALLTGEVSHLALKHLGVSPRKLKRDMDKLMDTSEVKESPYVDYGKIRILEVKDEGMDRSYVITKKALDAGMVDEMMSRGVYERYGSKVRKDRIRYKERAKSESVICICLKEIGCSVFEDEHYMPVIDSSEYVMDVPFGQSHYYTSKSLKDEERVRFGTEKINIAQGRNYGIWFADEDTYVVYYLQNKARYKSDRSRKYNGQITRFNRESEKRTWVRYNEMLRYISPERVDTGKKLHALYFGKTLRQLTRQLAFLRPNQRSGNSLERHFRETRMKSWFIPVDRSKRFLQTACDRAKYGKIASDLLFPDDSYRTSGGSFVSWADAVSADGSVYLYDGIDMEICKMIAFKEHALTDASHRWVVVCFDWQEAPYRVYFGDEVEYAVVDEKLYWKHIEERMGKDE